MSAPLWTGWTVVRQSVDGTEHTSTRYLSLTREGAVRAYEKASTANSFHHHEAMGVASLCKVALVLQEPRS